MCRSYDDCSSSSTGDKHLVVGSSTPAVQPQRAAQPEPHSHMRVTRPTDLDYHNSFTTFIVDWDDTLFPTSALQALGPETLRDAFTHLDSLVEQLLMTMLSVPCSYVVLLTNANLTWVFHAADEFMPKVSKLLREPPKNFELISAHRSRSDLPEVGTPEYIAAVQTWKREAIRPLSVSIQELIDDANAATCQVISVGDSPHDLEAAHALSTLLRCDQRLVKTVQMKPRPNHAELFGQLRAFSKALPTLAKLGRSLHQTMFQKRADASLPNSAPPSTCVSSKPAICDEKASEFSRSVPNAPADCRRLLGNVNNGCLQPRAKQIGVPMSC